MSLLSKNKKAERFEAAAAAYERPIYLLCLRMMGNREDAQDCAQEALLRAFRAFDQFRENSDLKTWLYRIAYNVCIDALRRRRASVSLDTLTEKGFDVPDDQAERAYEMPEQRERCELIKLALEKLPEEQRAVLILRDFRQLSYMEIAEILRQPEGTVKSRLSRARESVRNFVRNAEQNENSSVKIDAGRQK